MKRIVSVVVSVFVLSVTLGLFSAVAQEPTGVEGTPEDKAKRVEFLKKLQTAVAADDRATVVKMVSYPMNWNHGSVKGTIRNSAALLKKYNLVFNAAVKKAIADQKPEELFVRDQGTMIGSGEVWYSQINTGKEFFIITVNN
jgi:hypothetical protein